MSHSNHMVNPVNQIQLTNELCLECKLDTTTSELYLEYEFHLLYRHFTFTRLRLVIV